jgi:hypothetical protein
MGPAPDEEPDGDALRGAGTAVGRSVGTNGEALRWQ